MPEAKAAEQKALIDSTDDPMWSVDLEFRLVVFNRALKDTAWRCFHVRVTSGMRTEDMLPITEVERFEGLYRRALSEGAGTAEFLLRDGRTFEYSFSPVMRNGNPVGISVVGRNISARLAAERAHLEAESRYHTIFDHALEGIFQSSVGGKLIAANPAFARILGYKSAEELKSQVLDVRHQVWRDSRQRCELLKKLKECVEVRNFECVFRRKDGSMVWVQVHARLVRDAEGKPASLSGFCQDMTLHRQAEKARKAAESQYRDMFTRAQEGICRLTPDGHPIDSNPAMARMLGYDSVEEFLHGPEVAAAHSWLEPQVHALLKKKLRRGGVLHAEEFPLRRKDGSAVWVSANLRRVPAKDGGSAALEGFFQDVSGRKVVEEELRASEERYRSTFEQAGLGILHGSFEGNMLRCNTRLAEMMGYRPEEMFGRNVREFAIKSDLPRVERGMRDLISGKRSSIRYEGQYIRKDGSTIWVALTSSVQHDSDGRPLHFLGLAQDITAQKEAEEKLAAMQSELRDSEERYRIAFQTTLDAITIIRIDDGTYIECNPAFLRMVGYSREEIIGRSAAELKLWADLADRDRMEEMIDCTGACRSFEAQFRKKDGNVIWGMMSATRVELKGVPCVLAVTRDMTEAKQAEEEIRSLAFYDPLTSLPNRRLLQERLRQVVAANSRGGRFSALLFVDLDNFKTLNDTLGHHIGDLLLKEVAQRLSATVRSTDTVARLGGDEFVIMLENLSDRAEDAATLAGSVGEGILASVSAPCQLNSYECLSTCSIGITVFGERAGGVSEILQQADIAMYQAKAVGRNSLRFFAPQLQTAVNERATLEEDLRQAVRENQFELWYQPQVSSGRLVGAEALLRWRHPRRGILGPGEFIGLAEESGLILSLGNWALQQACYQIATWSLRKGLPPVNVAVNISARQFRQPDFVEQVLEAIELSGVNPESLTLELTESMLVENIEEVIDRMTALKMLGVHFALDDFGTGYSSLTYLKRLPLDQLKVDRSFVQDILEDPTSGAIAQTIVSLSRAMHLAVVAEGIETEEQRRYLQRLGCQIFQGYLFSRPLPVKDFEALPVAFSESHI
jgi:diguanylate cyclase (GGDEF)-like protein/PAS domain S-box-containing protein